MKVIVISAVAFILLVLVLFLFSVLKISSRCSRIEELNNNLKGDGVYE